MHESLVANGLDLKKRLHMGWQPGYGWYKGPTPIIVTHQCQLPPIVAVAQSIAIEITETIH